VVVILELGLVLLQVVDIQDRIRIQVSLERRPRVTQAKLLQARVTQVKLLPDKVILVKLPGPKVTQANSLLARATQVQVPHLLAKAIQVLPHLLAKDTQVLPHPLASSTKEVLLLAKVTQVVSQPQILRFPSGSMPWTKTDLDKLTARNSRRRW
jgi:hypothetical protein